jgi:hypothetical protein
VHLLDKKNFTLIKMHGRTTIKNTNMLFTFHTGTQLQKTVLRSNKDKQNLRFSQQCCEGFRSFGMLQCAAGRGVSGTEKECCVLGGKKNIFLGCLNQ